MGRQGRPEDDSKGFEAVNLAPSFLWVFLGGGLGAMARFSLSILLRPSSLTQVPLPNLTANLLGCFLIGLLARVFEIHAPGRPVWQFFLLTGILGGFTTFSSFGLETLRLYENRAYAQILIYVGVSVVGGLVLVWVGSELGRTH